MPTIKMLRDDEAVLSLKRQNTAAADIDDIDAIQPYPEINATTPKQLTSKEEKQPLQRHFKSRTHSNRKTDRRKRQRRRHNRAVLLDTRSNHQRRINLRRGDDLTSHKSQHNYETQEHKPTDRPAIGIDTLI